MHLLRQQLQTQRCQCWHRRGHHHYLEKRCQATNGSRAFDSLPCGNPINHVECSSLHKHVPLKSTYLPLLESLWHLCLGFAGWIVQIKSTAAAVPSKPRMLLLAPPCNSKCQFLEIIVPSCQTHIQIRMFIQTSWSCLISKWLNFEACIHCNYAAPSLSAAADTTLPVLAPKRPPLPWKEMTKPKGHMHSIHFQEEIQ